jgi:hypothetical protein
MNSLTRRIAVIAATLAAAGVIGANAADEQQPTPPASRQTAATERYVTDTAPHRLARAESPQFEWFESQMELESAPSYTPSEHPNAKPAPRSAHLSPPVWDDPMNTASRGQ